VRSARPATVVTAALLRLGLAGRGNAMDATRAERIAQGIPASLTFAQVHIPGSTTARDSAQTATPYCYPALARVRNLWGPEI
jgi:hypothetical protein